MFFSTTNALIPDDENTSSDVYEYDGSQLHLLSAGKGTDESLFRNASPDGTTCSSRRPPRSSAAILTTR